MCCYVLRDPSLMEGRLTVEGAGPCAEAMRRLRWRKAPEMRGMGALLVCDSSTDAKGRVTLLDIRPQTRPDRATAVPGPSAYDALAAQFEQALRLEGLAEGTVLVRTQRGRGDSWRRDEWALNAWNGRMALLSLSGGRLPPLGTFGVPGLLLSASELSFGATDDPALVPALEEVWRRAMQALPPDTTMGPRSAAFAPAEVQGLARLLGAEAPARAVAAGVPLEEACRAAWPERA